MTLFQQATQVQKAYVEKGYAPPPKSTWSNRAFNVGLGVLSLATSIAVMSLVVQISEAVFED